MVIDVFRHNLRAAIHAHPMRMTDICKVAGYNETYVRKVLGGKYNPTLLFAECMATAVNKKITELLERTEDGSDTNRVAV